jgi:KUP system potassium uptake protein
LAPTGFAIYGVLSLIVWSLIVVVSVKYVILLMRLDNRGEGGIVALLALLLQRRQRWVLIGLGLFGAALLYGDGVITPAISVLSAVEGLEVVTPGLGPWVVPITLLTLFLLFFVQKYGTGRVGWVFGPLMLLWFGTIGILGAVEIVRTPSILFALNPWYGLKFFIDHGAGGILVLGAVVLAVTGAEALYADMGHFGRAPIRLAWFLLVLPALLLNYFGQAALVLRAPSALASPFYLLAPPDLRYPLVALATLATVVASQALIAGAFSLTQQCVRLHYSPRVSVVHTSRSEEGQIYVPEVNIALAVGCLLLVLAFHSSSRLGAAYGIAVTGTMAVTTVLFTALAVSRWRWSALKASVLVVGFLAIDLTFFGANIVKLSSGGWVPLVVAGGIFLLMTTWNRGSELLRSFLARTAMPIQQFIREVRRARPPRVPGTAVFLTSHVVGAPFALQRHLRYNKVLHQEVILLTIVTEHVPTVLCNDRLEVDSLVGGFHRVRAHYGFMERPDVQEVLAGCRHLGLTAATEDTTYYVDRLRLLPTGPAPMMRWRKRLFGFMAHNAASVTDAFNIPTDRVVELGARVAF